MANFTRLRHHYALMLVLAAIGLFFYERENRDSWSILMFHIGALLAFGLYIRLHYRASRALVMSSFYQIYALTGLLLSAVQVSNGEYMFEIGEEGDANGSVWVLLLFAVVGLECSAVAYNYAKKRCCLQRVEAPSDSMTTIVIVAASGVALLTGLFVLIRYSSPVILGVDRVTFWRTVVPDSLSFVPSLVVQTFYFVAYAYLWRRKRGRGTEFAIALVLLYLLLTAFVLGEKFTAFMVYASVWLTILAGVYPQLRFRVRHYVWVLALFLLVLSGLVISYSTNDKEAAFIMERTALQAQLLWSVLHEDVLPVLPSGDWTCYFACGPFDDGKDYISYLYLPFGIYEQYSNSGSKLSGWMPALPILTFGILIAIAAHAVVSAALGYVQANVVYHIQSENLILGFLLFKIQLALALIWYAAMSSAVLGVIFVSVVTILYGLAFSKSGGHSGVRVFTLKNDRLG